LRDVVELGKHAFSRGSIALLLPMPFFFRYAQVDLAAYIRETVHTLEAPCLLYNLPSFTNPLEPETSISLLQSLQNLVGLKDSSGNRNALSMLEKARDDSPFTLMCGSDGVFFDAMEAGWDGGISGIASCCPEVLVALYDHHRAGRTYEARQCQELLDGLVEMVERLPFPWSIRIAAEARGFPNGPLPYPLSEQRRIQAAELRREYESWFDANLPRILSERISQSR
jgi:4-hydroxy-tetrahydrodipicolinate synthase